MIFYCAAQDTLGFVERSEFVAKAKEAAVREPDANLSATTKAPPGYAFDPESKLWWSLDSGMYWDPSSGGFYNPADSKWYSYVDGNWTEWHE